MGGKTAHCTLGDIMTKTKVIFGERISKTGELRLGCSAVIFDPRREQVLLTQRADNAQWCLPGGRVEAGESVAEACIREVWEETGLHVQVSRLIGVYSDPNKLVVYPDGNKAHVIALSFEAEIVGGELGGSNETIAWGYFSIEQSEKMEMLAGHLDRIRDAFTCRQAVIK
jgi:8-oxo-dGTP pyrophosphatase MutT (NUDIX family)